MTVTFDLRQSTTFEVTVEQVASGVNDVDPLVTRNALPATVTEMLFVLALDTSTTSLWLASIETFVASAAEGTTTQAVSESRTAKANL
jgi:hypothetical protein